MRRPKAGRSPRTAQFRVCVELLETRSLLTASVLQDINTLNLDPSQITDVAGSYYFLSADSNGRTELWRSDGTSAGTSEIASGEAGSESGFTTAPLNLTAVGSTLFFTDFQNYVEEPRWKRLTPAAARWSRWPICPRRIATMCRTRASRSRAITSF